MTATGIDTAAATLAMAVIVVHELLCLALFYSAFFRAVKSDERVHLDVRIAFHLLGAVACWGFVAPLLGYVPHWWGLALLAAVVLTQWITAQHWRQGVPERFLRPEHRPRFRRASDPGGHRGHHPHA